MTEYKLQDGRPLRLTRKPGHRGDRVIVVDGHAWGEVYSIGHGCHGPSYHFKDSDGDHIYLNGKPARDWNLERVHLPRARRLSWDTSPPRPKLDDALAAKIIELIASGQLRDPAVLASERRAQIARRTLEAAERAKREAQIKAVLTKIVRNRAADDELVSCVREIWRDRYFAEMPKIKRGSRK